jgi:hypothetical protein
MIEPDRILKLINQARKAYGAFELKNLQPGKPRTASHCPVCRSLRAGVEDWLFVAVGSKHLRVWALGKDPAGVGRDILAAWEMPRQRLKQSAEASGYVILPLPPELSEFVKQFDQGLLPDLVGEVDHTEVRQLRELARGIPLPRRQRNNGRNASQFPRSGTDGSSEKPASPSLLTG